jgi:hypothetical protein
MDDLPTVEHRVRQAVEVLPPRVSGLALRVLTMPQQDRARASGELWADERCRTFAELLMDLEEDPAARGVLLGVLRTMEGP